MAGTVILIDDEIISNVVAREVLRRRRPDVKVHDFLSAESAHAFLDTQLTQLEKPVTLFLDINMPEMNGFQFMDEFIKRGMDLHSRVCLLTSSLNERDQSRSQSFRAIQGFYIKPFRVDYLGV